MTGMDSLFRSPVRLLAQHLYEGTVSARSLLDHCLARIERLNPRLNAITFLDPDAKIAAEDSDRRLEAGRPRAVHSKAFRPPSRTTFWFAGSRQSGATALCGACRRPRRVADRAVARQRGGHRGQDQRSRIHAARVHRQSGIRRHQKSLGVALASVRPLRRDGRCGAKLRIVRSVVEITACHIAAAGRHVRHFIALDAAFEGEFELDAARIVDK